MEQQRLTYLLQQYGNDVATKDELAELQHFLASDEGREMFANAISSLMASQQNTDFDISPYTQLARQAVEVDKAQVLPAEIKPMHRVHFLRTAWFRYASVIVLALGIGGYFWSVRKKEDAAKGTAQKQQAIDIPPGKNGAVLTLADGSQLVLDSLSDGVVASQSGSRAVLNNGTLEYNAEGNAPHAIAYNTMRTPNGRQFHLVLPDGSTVWLNAASSIRYPTVFGGNERVVELEGEAYFEVAKNAKMPFRVKVDPATVVEVLGTSFNINSYDNESAIRTTLIEGSVRLHAHNQLQILKPGEQAQSLPNEKIRMVHHANIEQVMAWKNGYFDFNDADLQEMMRQLERWYDIRVTYEGQIPNVTFEGKMDRYVQLSDVVRFLELFGMNARLEERTLIIAERK